MRLRCFLAGMLATLILHGLWSAARRIETRPAPSPSSLTEKTLREIAREASGRWAPAETGIRKTNPHATLLPNVAVGRSRPEVSPKSIHQGRGGTRKDPIHQSQGPKASGIPFAAASDGKDVPAGGTKARVRRPPGSDREKSAPVDGPGSFPASRENPGGDSSRGTVYLR